MVHLPLNTTQVHRHTHRIVRGCLLAIGRPDGRLNALTSAEATISLSVYQATSIQNYGVTCETITIGHSPYKLPLSEQHITLPGKRSKFLCEAETDARLGPASLDGVSPGGLMGTMEDFMGSTTSLALSSLTWPHQKSRRNVAHSKLVNIEDIEPAFMGSWMKLVQEGSGGDPFVVGGRTVGDLMEKQRFLQVTPNEWRPLPLLLLQPTAQSVTTSLRFSPHLTAPLPSWIDADHV